MIECIPPITDHDIRSPIADHAMDHSLKQRSDRGGIFVIFQILIFHFILSHFQGAYSRSDRGSHQLFVIDHNRPDRSLAIIIDLIDDHL